MGGAATRPIIADFVLGRSSDFTFPPRIGAGVVRPVRRSLISE